MTHLYNTSLKYEKDIKEKKQNEIINKLKIENGNTGITHSKSSGS